MNPQSDPSHQRPRKRDLLHRLLLIALRGGLALGLAFFIAQFQLDYVESYLYDFRTRLRPVTLETDNVALIMVRPSTVEALKGQPTAKHHEDVLKILKSSTGTAAAHKIAPKAVVYNFEIEQVAGTDKDKRDWTKTARSFKNLFVVTDEMELKGQDGTLKLKPPFEDFPVFSGPRSRDISNFARDGVTRRMLIEYQEEQLLHPYLASLFNPDIAESKKIRGLFEFLGTQQVFIDFRAPGSYPTYEFERVLSGAIPPSTFANKIIIFGTDLNLKESEYTLTPYSREPSSMTTAEMHANMFDTLIRNSAPIKAPSWVNLIFICLVSILTVHVVLTLRPITGLLTLAFTFFIYSALSFVLLWIFGIWISMIHPLLTIFLAYYFFIPYRLIVENRKSWEYYQRNMLLQQVEELKTNFISMMSHDLKTPIARIQGMVDVIIRESSNMNSLQREAVDTIRSSGEDLLKFINSILNYAKIESSEVKLNIQSKDINALLEEVIKKHEFLAKLKQIQIVKELEPLFPVDVDSDLMKQVFSNLIENAIKYSPESTKILVSSEEKDSFVVVQVADQGPGISEDEIHNIFMKFFRSRNVKTSPIKGSGLGLYLAKYFTELHHGQISVESTDQQGSTFTVEIPTSQR